MILRWQACSAILLTLLTFCALEASAKKDPRITSKKLDNPPENAFYFDDSDVVLFQDIDTRNVWRSPDAGETWDVVEGEGQKGNVWQALPHPFDKKKAYILGRNHQNWVTDDRGKTWTKFETEASPSLFVPTLYFHGQDSSKALFEGGVCQNWECEEEILYTKDNFKTSQVLRKDAITCAFARSRPEFETSEDDDGDDRIICIVRGRSSISRRDFRIVVSDDYFKTEYEPALEGDRTVKGMMDIAQQSKYFLAAARAEGTDELALYVTDDAKQWHRAEFLDHKLTENAYTVLESTNYSLQIDVMTTKLASAMGVLFTSNSNGTYFSRNIEHTNRNENYHVDFEKVWGIQGIVIVNTVENWEEVEKTDRRNKKIRSKISFDDGRTFQQIKGKAGKDVHLHSVTDAGYRPRVFSSPAPGIIMGVGNNGPSLKSYKEGDLWVSDDAGLTWWRALDGPHRYEFGDSGSVLFAVADDEPTDKVQYSIDHGKSWTPVDVGKKFVPQRLMTTPDSTGLKFLLFAHVQGEEKIENYAFSFDFSELHERKCKDKDFEDWPARLNEKGEPDCLMGHKQFYRRRKADSECFISEEFKDPVPRFKKCVCSAEDFECDFNFIRSEDGKDCIPSKSLSAPAGACEEGDEKYTGSSGWRLITGDVCNREKGKDLDKEVERPCKAVLNPPPSGNITHEKINFDAERYEVYSYLERTETSTGEDESVVMQTADGKVWLTKDHGKTWQEILKGKKITGIHPNKYFNDYVFFTTNSKKAYYSIKRGDNIREFEGPSEPNKQKLDVIGFHPDFPDWIIWTGAKGCEDGPESPSCHSISWISTDRGATWKVLLRYVRKCEFIKPEGRGKEESSEKLVYCEQYKDEDPKERLQLVSSNNWFADRKVHFANLVDFATKSEFIVVATRASDETLKVDASVDGKNFADAEFPHGFVVEHQNAYTVLKSDTHAVFLHVTVQTKKKNEYGAIIKSNSNGTSYVMVHRSVNRDQWGYVDFEKVQGIEGVDVINVVANTKDADEGKGKKLQTMITHNDGAEYGFLAPPDTDAAGKNWGCSVTQGKGTSKCALHLHGYTERKNAHNTYSSSSAVGLMMGLGNVGESLTRREESDTFLSSDGGISWKCLRKGQFLWEYGDQGSILLIVEESKPTKIAHYSLDEGETWKEYPFSDVPMRIDDVSTVPSDTSRQFMLWGKEDGEDAKDGVFTVNIDFRGLTDKQCYLDEDYPADKNNDYYLWEPRHPLQGDNCLFGHVAQYHRKKLGSNCYNGHKIEALHMITKDCPCTRRDYEW
jgi:photosystem II stability/assembly factor-like uncharacterized protein